MTKVFLGGTCNESSWRDVLIPMLNIDYFNPVVDVDDWTSEQQQIEIYERSICDFCLYVVTPKMTGVYSIAEVVDDSNKKPFKTIFCFLLEDEGKRFDKGQIRSLEQVASLVSSNGAQVLKSLNEIAVFLNGFNEFYDK
jgi:hypothetical protein